MARKKKPCTYVVLVLDKSGSMKRTADQTIAGLNEKIQQFKQDAKTQKIFVSLVSFDGDVYEHFWNIPAKDLQEATVEDIDFNGSTAMRDAIGYSVSKLIKTTDSDDENVSYLVEIISDGDTNADKHYNESSLLEIIQGTQSTKKWTYSYMGCTEECLRKVARETSIPLSNMANWSNLTAENTSLGFSKSSGRTAQYFRARASGQSAVVNYMSDCIGSSADFTKEAQSSNIDNSAPVSVDYSIVDNSTSPPTVGVAMKFPNLTSEHFRNMLNEKFPKYQEEKRKRQSRKSIYKRMNQINWINNSDCEPSYPSHPTLKTATSLYAGSVSPLAPPPLSGTWTN